MDDFLAHIAGFTRPSVIVAHEGSYRAVAAEHAAFHCPANAAMPFVQEGASDYLLHEKWAESPEKAADKPFPTLDNAMVQNWADNPAFVSYLLGHPPILTIFQAVFGPDFKVVIDRFCQQKPGKDSKLAGTCHVDYPEWKKCPPDELPPTTLIGIQPGTIVIIVIDQGRPHGIPTAGDSKGVFVGALSDRKAYEASTMKLLGMPMKLGRPQYWLGLRRLDRFEEVMAANLLTATRPPLFPSLKRVLMPAGHNGSRYKHFKGYTLPDQDVYWTLGVLARVRAKHGDTIANWFVLAAKKALTGPKCARDPSLLSPEAMKRFF